MTNRIANGPPPGFAPFTHVIRLESVGVFQCPAVPMVPPAIILPGLEYLELLTGGVVLDDSEREYGPGTLFWHLPGEPTVHRTRPEAPYRCLCVQFAVTAPRRQVPRRTMAGDGIWARALTDELLAAFHDARCDRDALALYAYGRLLWAAKTAPPEAADSGPPAPLRRLLHLLEGRPDLLQAGVAELDRVYAPDTTTFVPVLLDGSKHRGKTVFIRAVDDADQATFSMLCIDDVRTADFPGDFARPVKPLPAFDLKRSLRLEDKNCSVEVSRANGSITRIRDKKTGLDLLLEPRLAGSYRFALPIPGREPWQTIEANWVFGKDQKLTAHRLEGNRLTLHWDGPLKNYLREPFDVSVTMTIELRDEGVWFGLKINNPTRYAVGETYFPVLGGIQGLGTTRGQLQRTEMVRPSGASASARKRRGAGTTEAAPAPTSPGFTASAIFKVFDNMAPFGDQGPEQFYAYPESQPEPWVGFYAPQASRSVLISARDPTDRALYLRLELIPSSSGAPRDDGNWPRPSELRGAPVGVEFSFVDVKGGPAGKSYEAAPVFLRFLDGGGPEMIKGAVPEF